MAEEDLYALDAEQADGVSELLRERTPRRNVGTVPAAAGGRNYQGVERVAGDLVEPTEGHKLYPGKIVWQPAARDLTVGADCWIDPVSAVAPRVGQVCFGIHNGFHERKAVFWGFDCGRGPGGRTAQTFTRCINGDLTTYEVGTDGVPRITRVQAGCCDNDSGTHTGGAYDGCTSPVITLDTGDWKVPSLGGDPAGADPACLHVQPSICLAAATLGGDDPAAPADTCGDGTGQVWTGTNLSGAWALYKCGLIWCLSVTPIDPSAEPVTYCTSIPPSGGPCDVPTYLLDYVDPVTGSPFTATVTPTAGASCTWNCWVSGTGDPGSTLHYCATSDDSGTATLVSGPYTTEAACVSACPGDHYCIQQLVYDAADTGCAGDPVATLDSVCAVEWSPDGCFVDSGGNPTAYQVLSGPYATHAACIAACAAPWYCWQWVHYTDADCTTPSGETEAGVCAQTIDDTCMPTGDGYRKRQIVSGPYTTHDDCSGAC